MNVVKRDILIFLIIFCFFGLSLGLSFVNMSGVYFYVVLAIALIQDVMIWLFFMELIEDRSLSPVFGLVGLAWIGILITFTLCDFLTRHWLLFPAKWPVTMEFSPPLGGP